MEMDSHEIDEGAGYVGFREAFELIRSNVKPIGTEEIPLERSGNRIAAEHAVALVNYPSIDVSLKDGFAVKSSDVAQASEQNLISLKVIGSAFAGTGFSGQLGPGSTVKVCSGAPIPSGAEAVVSAEFCDSISEEEVRVRADAGIGRNILRTGTEVRAGDIVVRSGSVFRPGNMGLAAAAGISKVCVCRRPKAAILGVGDEVIAPGETLRSGQVYASNLIMLRAWLDSFGIDCVTSVVRDSVDDLKRELEKQFPGVDLILTSGGAWGSERDLVIGTFGMLGWQQIFHHVRMGPGKGIAFGLWNSKPVFCLPGGPASNEMAFLQLALPGILRMSGDIRHPLPIVFARLSEDLKSRHDAWTEFRKAIVLRDSGGGYKVIPCRDRSRLQAIADADGLICIPEGTETLSAGAIIPVQMLIPRIDIESAIG